MPMTTIPALREALAKAISTARAATSRAAVLFYISSTPAETLAKARAEEAAAWAAVDQAVEALAPTWPDFNAPQMYDSPAEGWEDPALPDFRAIWQIARTAGYTVGLHGSMKRDCDLIAVPWVNGAMSSEELVRRLCIGLNAQQIGEMESKPYRRVAVTLQLKDKYAKPIDLSIVSRDDSDQILEALAGPDAGDLTTPHEPDALYLPQADIVSWQSEDAPVVARRHGEDIDVLLSTDRTRVLGFQIHGASRFGERLLKSIPVPSAASTPQPEPAAGGWVTVRREPTPEVLEAICCSMDRPDWLVHARQAWEVAIAASPSPPGLEGVEAALRAWFECQSAQNAHDLYLAAFRYFGAERVDQDGVE